MNEKKPFPIPVVPAGPAAPADPAMDAALAGCSGAESFALMVLGDSMEPEFVEGDIIIIEPEGLTVEGSYVMAWLADEWIFRQLVRADANEPTPETFAALGSPLKGQETLGAARRVIKPPPKTPLCGVLPPGGQETLGAARRVSSGGWKLQPLNPKYPSANIPDLSVIKGVIIQKSKPGRRRAAKRYVD